MPPHQSPHGDSFPSRGSLWPRQKAAPPQESLPLEGKVPNGCEADEVGRESPCNLNRKGTRPSALYCTAIASPREKRCHLISRLTATASPRGEAYGLSRKLHRRKKATPYPIPSRCASNSRHSCSTWPCSSHRAARLGSASRPLQSSAAVQARRRGRQAPDSAAAHQASR